MEDIPDIDFAHPVALFPLASTALMPNAAPGRAKFHEVGDPVAVCWRHDAGVFLCA